MAKDILSIFCPGCGAPAEYDIVHQFYRCSYCGGTVGLEAASDGCCRGISRRRCSSWGR